MESINQIRHQAAGISRKSRALLAYTGLTLMASMLMTTAKAQTFSEWFSQKKTQKKYLLQQIAALQVYSAYLRQGYNIANNGLGSISGSLKNEFDLHTTYYDKLKTVSPVVKDNQQVKDILTWQQDILTEIAKLNKGSKLNGNEQAYIQKVKDALLNDCSQRMNELQNVVTTGKLQMSDEERLRRVSEIHTAMQDNYRFACAFTGQVKVYLVQQQQESADLQTRKKLIGIR